MKKSKPQKTETNKDRARKNGKEDFLVVGIGASAGGVQALKSFFENVPADSGAAYIVILHLSPDHDSQLAEVLQTVARIPVTQVTKKVKVAPNHVYVVSPNESLSMLDGHIIVSPIHTIEERRAPVDIFFRTLGESHTARAIAVILSGTGADGSMGIKRVKENGGTAFVQNPREAEFSEMPRNSIATDLIDEVLNVAEIPAKIVAYRENLGKVVIAVEPEAEIEEQQSALREIFTHLRVRTGHDFTNYKRATVLRRIERRINVRVLPNLPAYAAYLRANNDETQALLKDLLISVTNFFRNKKAFQYLEAEIIPKILEGKKSGEQIRLWVAGCATGEEAYSLAMLLAEKINAAPDAPTVQIFATDIDEDAIASARNGFYTLNDAADVSPERLRRFFTKEKEGYRIRRELRELILFAKHNLLKDPPFSRLDLATCRNLLIYFNRTAQERAMETFHFALQPGGYLFLGSSESVDGANDLYTPVSREYRIFQSRATAPRFSYPVPDLSPSFRFDQPLPAPAENQENKIHSLERVSYGDLHGDILEQYAPPSIVVNEQYDVVHVSARAGRYLQVTGEPSNNLFKLIRPELKLELSTAVYQAVQRQTNVAADNLKVQIDDRIESVNVNVRPVLRRSEDTIRGFILIIFEQAADAPGASEAVFMSPEPITRQLEEALLRSQTDYRTAIEQSEIQAEELKASNEELQAINEELRSATEELETGKEELQSVNEELITVNQELKIKIEELSLSNNDFQNLINSTNIGTIFLDRNLRVKLFTPAAKEIFNLIPADNGRLLSDITHKLEYQDFIHDVETVLNTLQEIEREVHTVGGSVYMLQITPYRTSEHHINGAIISFINITKRKQAEEALSESAERMSLIITSVEDYAIITTDLKGIVTGWNLGAEKMFGYTESEMCGQSADIIFTPEDRKKGAPDIERRTALEKGKAEDERFHLRKDGSRFYVSGVMQPLKDGKIDGFVKIARDMTERIKAEQAQRDKEMLQKLVSAQEDERKRIARDLHDELGQQLTALRLRLESVRKLCDDNEELCGKIDETQTIARHLDAGIDFLAWELRPAALDDLGLRAALEKYVNEWSHFSGVTAELIGSALKNERFTPEVETNLYRIAQEALNNVHKHAKAKSVEVSLEKRGSDLIVLIIADNGKDFNPKNKANQNKGIGLIGMQERAVLIGGRMEIESAPKKGTTIFVRVPVSFDKKEKKNDE
ncbi:MAG: CheR family methyltransferase [Pyrinomonadaceae bacterium]